MEPLIKYLLDVGDLSDLFSLRIYPIVWAIALPLVAVNAKLIIKVLTAAFCLFLPEHLERRFNENFRVLSSAKETHAEPSEKDSQ